MLCYSNLCVLCYRRNTSYLSAKLSTTSKMSPNKDNNINKSPMWKKPDEVMQLHRLKRKKKALQERMRQKSFQNPPDFPKSFGVQEPSLNFSRLLGGDKRKNPFSKNFINQDAKKFKESSNAVNLDSPLDESADSTLFQLLNLSSGKNICSENKPHDKLFTFTNLLNKFSKEQELLTKAPDIDVTEGYVPVDWALKTKIRFMSPKPFAWNQKLKASEEASGITGFVRCLDTSNLSTLDTSHHSRFHQHCLYWQHPNLPWLSLFPRSSGKVAVKSFITTNEEIKVALQKEWTESFRSLFQLVRAKQCPYFYVCANTFTCLFRAAGIGGLVETCALLTPTTRGLRQTLKQEEIEYTMPLRKNEKRKSGELHPQPSNEDRVQLFNTSPDSCYDTMDNLQSPGKIACERKSITVDRNNDDRDEVSDDEEFEADEWLESLGVGADEIRKINHSQVKINHAVESTIDSGSESLICVQGVDAQALFNFLLNCKSSIPATGPFGGIPPTLLAPTAFQGGTLQPLKVRESVVHSEGGKYYSVELRGPILPTAIHSLCSLLQSNPSPFSATFANLQPTVPFSKAAKLMATAEESKENPPNEVPGVFSRENLSDCGLNPALLQSFCSSNSKFVETIDSLAYSHEKDSYSWS